jgi:hypothetical protein
LRNVLDDYAVFMEIILQKLITLVGKPTPTILQHHTEIRKDFIEKPGSLSLVFDGVLDLFRPEETYF